MTEPAVLPITRRIRVEGRVQGVGYRMALTETALGLGLNGWVRNRADGSVEALVHGHVSGVEHLVDWCERGPDLARVGKVSVSAEDWTGPKPQGFLILPTA